MNWMKPNSPATPSISARKFSRHCVVFCLLFMAWNFRLTAADLETNVIPSFNVSAYEVAGSSLVTTHDALPQLASHTGEHITLNELILAASELHYEFCRRGYPLMSVAIAQDRITNGIVTLNVFQTAVPQVVVSGKCYWRFTNDPPAEPASPAEIARVRDALMQEMTDLKEQEKLAELAAQDKRIHVVSTNAGPRFAVKKYLIEGNTVLTPQSMSAALTNIDGAFGTNVSFDGIRTAVTELQKTYREHGFVTVAVGVPQQKLANGTVKLQVTEGRLVLITVAGNRYFSSNNVMRALPSLHTNIILNGPIFQAELNRANANQDRQIYPVISPGPDPGTSALTLKVKDQVPIHGKVEFNNQNSPGTPDLRINTSIVDNNLWQLEHSLGFQYGFSPQQYKEGNQWNFYDLPLIANYSGFYRMPLGNQEPIEQTISDNQGSFGYSEATRQFRLPPPTGRSELNIYGSRSTSDTGATTTPLNTIEDIPGFLKVTSQNAQEDTTINQDVGFRLSVPGDTSPNFQSGFSGGLDYKTYEIHSVKTNNFYFSITTFDQNGNANSISSLVASPVPVTESSLDYLPLALGYNASWRSPLVTVGFGLGGTANTWFTSTTSTNGNTSTTGKSSLQGITGSKESTGYWFTLTPNLSVDFNLPRQWVFSLHANGQWSSEPLISTEQFGIGGVSSVRGYHEGENFGDTGWRFSAEQQTPPHTIGMVNGNQPLTVRGLAFMDRATTYLLDPQGRPNQVDLWSTGFGFNTSVGSHWGSRLLFSWPLIGTSSTPIDVPVFSFDLNAQF